MRRLLTSFALAAACACGASEPASDPAVTVSVPDLGATLGRFTASAYGRAYAAGPSATLDRLVSGFLAQPLAMLESSSLPDLATRLKGLEIAVLPGAREPQPVVQVRGTAALLARVQQLLGPAGAGAVIADGALRFAPDGGTPVAVTPAAGDSDLSVRWIAGPLLGLIPSHELDDTGRALLTAMVPDGEASLGLVPEGLHLRVALSGGASVKIPGRLAPSSLQWVPASASLVAAVHLDVQALWDAHAATFLDLARQKDPQAPKDPAALLGLLDLLLLQTQVPVTAPELLQALRGTMTVCCTAGNGLLPGVTIGIDRNPALDRLLEWALVKGGHGAVRDGELALLTLRNLGKSMPLVATGVGIVRDQQRWLVSTDAVQLADILSGRAGSWVGTASGAAFVAGLGSDVIACSWGDTRQGLRMLALGPTMLSFAEDAGPARLVAEDLQWIVHRLCVAAGPDVLVVRSTPTGLMIEGSGPLGGLPLVGGSSAGSMAIVAGMTLPAIGQVRAKARETQSANNIRQLVTLGVAYDSDHGIPPPDLESMIKAFDMPAKLMESPLAPGRRDSYLYLPTGSEGTSGMPVIIEDPANHRGRGTLVGFADGHTEFVSGERAQAWWEFALQLRERLQSEKRSAVPADWAPMLGNQVGD